MGDCLMSTKKLKDTRYFSAAKGGEISLRQAARLLKLSYRKQSALEEI